MRTILIGTTAALALVTGVAFAQGGGGGEQNTTVPRAGSSTMAPSTGNAGSSNWSAGNPGGTTAGSGATGGYSAQGTAANPGSVSSTGSIDTRSNATSPGTGRTYDTLKQGGSGSSGAAGSTTSGSSGKTTSGSKSSMSPSKSQTATGTHCPPGTPDCAPARGTSGQ